jgi:hypothetical protein
MESRMNKKLLVSSLLATVVAAIFPASANAAYSVSVRSSSRAGHAGPTACNYNYGGTGCSGIGTADGTSGGVSYPGTDQTGSTQATVTTAQTGVDYGQTQPESTSMTVSADLATGSLSLSSTNIDGAPSSSYGSGGYAELSDILHFTVAGAGTDTVTPITVTFGIDGTMFSPNTSAPNTGVGEFYGTMVFGSSDAQFYFLNDASTEFVTQGSGDTYPSAYPGTWTFSSDYSTALYSEIYYITGATADVLISANADLNCYNGSSCQYGNTAKFGISTAAGTSFTSDSGVFMSASQVAVVPEPASWAMMVVGFGVIGGTMRGRGKALRFA